MTHLHPTTPGGQPSNAPTAQHPSASPTTAYLADEVGHLSLGFLLIDATRYNLGRPGEPARQFAFALAKTLPEIVPHVRQQLVQDIGHALHKDAVARAIGHVPHFTPVRADGAPRWPLGTDADRQAWQGLLQVAAVLGTVPDEFRAEPAGS